MTTMPDTGGFASPTTLATTTAAAPLVLAFAGTGYVAGRRRHDARRLANVTSKGRESVTALSGGAVVLLFGSCFHGGIFVEGHGGGA